MLILFRIVQGFQKYIWLVCQTSPEMGLFSKLTMGLLKFHIGALELSGSTQSVTFLIFDKIFCDLLEQLGTGRNPFFMMKFYRTKNFLPQKILGSCEKNKKKDGSKNR